MKCKLTASQLSIWVGQKLHPEIPLYNTAASYEFSGAIDELKFKAAFQNLLDHTDAFRMQFHEEGGEPYQQVQPAYPYALEVLDFTQSPNERAIAQWLSDRTRRMLDITKQPFDTALLKVASNRYIWFLNLHHLITDGASRSIMFNRLSRYYEALMQGKEPEPPETAPYLDYVKSELANENSQEEHSNYWTEQTESIESLPVFYGQRVKDPPTVSTRVAIRLGDQRTQRLLEKAHNSQTKSFTLQLTLFNIFSALLMTYLYKVSGQNKLAIGTTNHSRSSRKFKQTIGHFVKIFPLVSEILPDDTFSSLIRRVTMASNENLKYGITAAVTPEINRSYNVIFNYISTVFPDFAGIPTTTEWLHNGHIDTAHHFQCHLTDFNESGNYNLYFDLNNQLFSEALRDRIPEHFLNVIDTFLEDENSLLEQLAIITDKEVKQIAQWNATDIEFESAETLLTKFERQVQTAPHATALVFGRKEYTYNELNDKANQVANFLLTKGIGNNDLVAISFERSLEMMIYIYGIIKAGAAYLPIDSNSPAERLRFIAEDASFRVLLYNHEKLNVQLPDISCFHIKEIEEEIELQTVTAPKVLINTGDLAYVIYTSGSTGEPKGVKCHHKGITNRLNWMNNDYPINQNDTLIQKTPITFDVSLWELFWPLQQGARLVIEQPDGHKDPEQLIASITANSVTVIHFVPSMLSVFNTNPGITNCGSLKRIFCSGEALAASIVKQTYKALPHTAIYNLYGPTEASVDVSSWHCEKNKLEDGVPIGYAVANTQLYILDEQLKLVPLGTKGELYIGGVQLASGYLNRDQLTKARFINNPFSSTGNAKIYKTGDLARYRNDGAIEYLGRTDSQVKIRGIRVELGEIEKVIEQHCEVSQVAVVIDKKEVLIAYYTADTAKEIRFMSILPEWLPEYMIPTHFQLLEEMPLSKNGKINKRALRELDTKLVETTTTFVAPEGEIEELLAEIWKDVLGLERVGAHDNFIALGGHSLAAIRVTTRINETIEINFKLNKIFEHPTISEYALYIEETLTELLS